MAGETTRYGVDVQRSATGLCSLIAELTVVDDWDVSDPLCTMQRSDPYHRPISVLLALQETGHAPPYNNNASGS